MVAAMKRVWSHDDLEQLWLLNGDEHDLIPGRTARNRLGFALLLKFFQLEGRFPNDHAEFSPVVVSFVAQQLRVAPRVFSEFGMDSRATFDFRIRIREHIGFRAPTEHDADDLALWLQQKLLPDDPGFEHLLLQAKSWYRDHQIELPAEGTLDRTIRGALSRFEEGFCVKVSTQLTDKAKEAIDDLIVASSSAVDTATELESDQHPEPGIVDFNQLKTDPGRPGLESVLREVAKLKRIDAIGLPPNMFADAPSKQLQSYRQRAAAAVPSALRELVAPTRYTLVAAFCWQRRREILDGLAELLIQIIHRIGARAERKVEKELLEDFRKVRGKTAVLFKMAEAAVEHPDGVVKEVLYPVVGVQTLKDLVKEFKATGPGYREVVHTIMRASYSSHYRRMLPHILDALPFCSNNAAHRPVIEALELLKEYRESRLQHFPRREAVPIDGVVAPKWLDIVLDVDKNGVERVNRINYEICVLQALRDGLRSKEIWVDGADRFRNPDEDLPGDFEQRRDGYYATLDLPHDPDIFIRGLQEEMRTALAALNQGLPKNAKLRILERGAHRISLTPLDEQPEPKNLAALKTEILNRWPATSLLDVLKEAELRIGFTRNFQTSASRETLDRNTLQRRLLLCLYGLGTNTGLKRVLNGDESTTYKELLYTRRRFVQKSSLRTTIAQVVNAIFAERRADIWGEGTTACASDSKKFGSWDQNLMTEWHIRYGGRGVMIYWHVERKSTCIYSQLKRCSSSEVAAMIEGVLRHCTDMEVEKNYVDSHGQSEVAFAFCQLLGFDLLPRLKAINSQKLYLPTAGDGKNYANLQPILTRPIQWEIIAKQYDEMVKYTTALRIGSAEPESILRRFTRGNVQHPTYRALAELGKAVKTIFLCRYLHSEALRREIHEGLNVVENWNSANAFIFYGKGGEVASNQLEDQELSVLALHLVQICLVYVNTLMIQRVLNQDPWKTRLKEADLRALTPLIYAHVNPYGRFELDMEQRLPLDEEMESAA